MEKSLKEKIFEATNKYAEEYERLRSESNNTHLWSIAEENLSEEIEKIVSQPVEGEPVAWRWLTDNDAGKWKYSENEPHKNALGRGWPGWRCEPLYAHPKNEV